MEFKPLASKLTAIPAAIGARRVSIFPLGITARLTISLAAVAVLAAAANMIAQESVSIIRMSTVPHIPPAAHSTAPSRKSIDALTSAVDRYERASQLRAEIDSDTNDAGSLSATNKLRSSSLDYREGASAKNAKVAEVGRLVAEYLDRGQALIHVADQRRSARMEYSDHSEAIDRRMQQSLDGALKIFGHVIARQSQMQLRSYLDAIRKHSRNIVSGDAVSTDEIDLLAANEKRICSELRGAPEKPREIRWLELGSGYARGFLFISEPAGIPVCAERPIRRRSTAILPRTLIAIRGHNHRFRAVAAADIRSGRAHRRYRH